MPSLGLLVTLAAVICVHGLPVSPDYERLRSGGEVHGAWKGEGEQVAPAVVSGRPVHAAGRTVLSSEDNCLSWTERLPASLWYPPPAPSSRRLQPRLFPSPHFPLARRVTLLFLTHSRVSLGGREEGAVSLAVPSLRSMAASTCGDPTLVSTC